MRTTADLLRVANFPDQLEIVSLNLACNEGDKVSVDLIVRTCPGRLTVLPQNAPVLVRIPGCDAFGHGEKTIPHYWTTLLPTLARM